MSTHPQAAASGTRLVASRGEQNGPDVPVPLYDLATSDRADSEAAARRLRLDNEDLRFECRRLKTSLALAQAEVLRLSEHNVMLQRRLERFRPYIPAWATRLIRVLARALKRH
jgi:hypothetical protein